MKRTLSRLLPLLIPACMVDTPVVEGPGDRLGEGLRDWCEGACARFTECDQNESDEDCVPECMDTFEEAFIGKGPVCAAGANRIMDCIDTASCTDLGIQGACNFESELEHCAASYGLVTCQSGGGSEGGSAGVAGTGGTGVAVPCELTFEQCSDGLTYQLACNTNPAADPVCDCMVDGSVIGSFAPLPSCPDASLAIQICAWPIADEQNPFPLSALCRGSSFNGNVGGSAGSASMDGCQLSFTDCSDNHSYDVACYGPGTYCDCWVDGDFFALSASPVEVCSFALGPDRGTAAVNSVCGFSIRSDDVIGGAGARPSSP